LTEDNLVSDDIVSTLGDRRAGRHDLPAAAGAGKVHTSEPLTFGIDEGQAPAFLASRGFQNVVDVGTQELISRYFDPHAKHRYIKPWWRIVSGEVGAAVGGFGEATRGSAF